MKNVAAIKFLLVPICLFIGCLVADEVIYIIPPSGYEDGRLFDLNQPLLNRDDCIKHFDDLRKALTKLNYRLVTARPSEDLSNGKYIIMSGFWTPEVMSMLRRYPAERLIACLWEPTTVNQFAYDKSFHTLFSKIFIMHDGFVDDQRYFKLYYPHPALKMTDNIVAFGQKNLCTHISSFCSSLQNLPHGELYSERQRAIRFFEKYPQDFVFFGKGWRREEYPGYGGSVVRKLDVLKKYRFSICYENTVNMPGYISEKIFDSFQAGCVPVYFGAPNVSDYIPANCFIDFRKFSNYEALYCYLKHMKADEYNKYLVNIRDFLAGDAAFKFSTAFFIDTLLNVLQPGYDKGLVFDKKTIERLKRARKNV